MLVLVSYDVNVSSENGQRRLRHLAKQCENYGIRVQNSVFECVVDAAKWEEIKAKLLAIAELDKDSLRFYHLGNKYASKIEHYGAKSTIKVEETLIL